MGDAQIPSAVQRAMKGRAVHVGVAELTSGLSKMGTHTVVLTDRPAAYLHDTGGFLGTERLIPLSSPKWNQTWSAYWAEDGALVVEIAPTATTSATLEIKSRKRRAEVAEVVFGPALPPEATDDLGQSLPLAIAAEIAGDVAKASLAALTPTGPPEYTAAWHLNQGHTVACFVSLRGRQLQIVTIDGTLLLDSPVEAISVEREGRQFRLRGRFPVAGVVIAAFSFSCPTADRATRLEAGIAAARAAEAVGQPDDVPNAVGGRVAVRGMIAGQPFASEAVHILLTDESLLLRDTERDADLCHFDLASAWLEGTHKDFVIADADNGPVSIAPAAPQLCAALLASETINAAAERSLRDNVFLGHLAEHEPALVRIVDGSVTFVSAGAAPAISASGLDSLELELSVPAPVLHIGAEARVSFCAPLPVLEPLAEALSRHRVAVQVAENLENACRAVTGLERDYLAYSVFGGFAETHLRLREVLGVSHRSLALEAPADDDTRAEVLLLLGTAAASLRAHLRACVHVFPEFIVQRDAALFRTADEPVPPLLSEQREDYARVFAIAGALTEFLTVIVHETRSLAALRQAMEDQDPGLGGLALSLGASAINPVLLFSSAQQLMSRHTATELAKTTERSRFVGAAETCVLAWNELMETLGPVVLRVLEAASPMREAVANTLAERAASHDDPRGIRAELAARMARLHNFARFPEPGITGRPRSVAIELLDRCQREIRPRFANF